MPKKNTETAAAQGAEADAELTLAPSTLAKRLSSEEKLVIIDVRTEEEYRALHLEKARLATRELVDEIFEKWAKDTPLVLYDHHGQHALGAARSLAKEGFTNAKALAGGIDAWSQAIDPLLPRY